MSLRDRNELDLINRAASLRRRLSDLLSNALKILRVSDLNSRICFGFLANAMKAHDRGVGGT